MKKVFRVQTDWEKYGTHIQLVEAKSKEEAEILATSCDSLSETNINEYYSERHTIHETKLKVQEED